MKATPYHVYIYQMLQQFTVNKVYKLGRNTEMVMWSLLLRNTFQHFHLGMIDNKISTLIDAIRVESAETCG